MTYKADALRPWDGPTTYLASGAAAAYQQIYGH
jgi:hypothetical protein